MFPEPKVLALVIERIVTAAQPLRIILFGSAARGDMRATSDIDVMVVVPEGRDLLRVDQDIHMGLRGVGIPIDVVVTTQTELERYRNAIGLVYRSACRDGRDIYVA